MGEKIDPTWLAWSYREEPAQAEIEAGVGRLKEHYGPLADYPLSARTATCRGQGMVVLGDAEPRCRWPFFAEDEDLAAGFAYVPSGFGSVTGVARPCREAALALAGQLVEDPGRSRDLAPPFAMSILDKRSGELMVLTDFLAAGRCLEVSFEGGRTLWTNRAAALFLFAGEAARADHDSWQVLAGSGWLMGRRTPFAGVESVRRHTAIRASDGKVQREDLGILPELVLPSASYAELRDRAGEETLAQVRLADALWESQTTIELSGGRDSRLIAAAAVAVGSDARAVTSDRTIGEADVALELMARRSGALEHKLRKTTDDEAKLDRPLLKRALNVHLLHDGMRHPQKVRGNQDLPRQRPEAATLSGHGGEIAHGFYYKNRRDLAKIAIGGRSERERWAMKLFPKVDGLARPECLEAGVAATGETLDAGEDAGLKGFERLEWFYLTDRFPNRQGLASHAERLSVFAMPSFVAAAFGMRPRDRMASRLHNELVARFVPEWKDAPIFKPKTKAGAATRRRRLWKSPDDAAAVEELLASEGPWTDLFMADPMREAWDQLKAGNGNKKWEAAFETAVYREAFEDYLERINSIAERKRPG